MTNFALILFHIRIDRFHPINFNVSLFWFFFVWPFLIYLVEYIQFGIFAIVPGISSHQIIATKLLHSNSIVDICAIIQSTAIRLSLDCYAVFHLFGGWNAGEIHNFDRFDRKLL